MKNFTQGTIISSIRSKKYFDCYCYGVVISARCDIANDKITKIYYVEALDLENWIFSNVGFGLIISPLVNSIVENLQKICESNNLAWEIMKDFSSEEFIKVADEEMSKKDSKKAKENFEKYKLYTNKKNSLKNKKEILKDIKKTAVNYVSDIANGKYTHFVYIPPVGVEDQIRNGLIIDLQELDYFDIETVKDLVNCDIDIQNSNLDNEKKILYNEKFILDKDPGYSIMLCETISPWTEYMMQRFSNVFTRIGVENPSKENISLMIDEIIK